jgi:hypothetical protein
VSNPHPSPPVAGPGPAGYLEALRDATAALDRAGVAHLVFGSIALRALGRRRAHPDEDIDLLIRPPDAPTALRALTESGFQEEEVDPSRLNRASRRGVAVDMVFRTAGDLHLDEEMVDRAVSMDVEGVPVRLIPPEDLAVMKAVLYEEHRPYDWFDALALVGRPDMDWPYLVRRALRHGAQRVLSLLVYARSSGLAVPQAAIEELTAAVEA